MLNSPIQSIFISYAPVDRNFVQRLATDLRARNFRVWVDNRQIHSSQIQQAIDSCQVMLVVLSPDAVRSQWVQDEYGYGLHTHKLVIPFRYQRCATPLALNNIQWVDFQGTYEQSFNDLLSALKIGESTGTLTLPPISPEEAAKRERARKIRTFPAIVLGATRASALGLIMGVLALTTRVGVLGIIGVVLGLAGGMAIEIAEETNRHGGTLSTPMKIVRVIGGGGIRMVAAAGVGVLLGSLSQSTAVAIIGGIIGAAVGIFSEVGAGRNWSAKALTITVRIVRVIIEGAIGLAGGLCIGLDIGFIYVLINLDQILHPLTSCSNPTECLGKAIGAILLGPVIIALAAFVVGIFGALIGAILGLIAGIIVESSQP